MLAVLHSLLSHALYDLPPYCWSAQGQMWGMGRQVGLACWGLRYLHCLGALSCWRLPFCLIEGVQLVQGAD